MRAKTIFVIFLSVMVTIVVMQNADEVWFNIYFWKVSVSKLIVMGVLAIISFVAGLLAGRRRKKPYEVADEIKQNQFRNQGSDLSDEDKNYIS